MEAGSIIRDRYRLTELAARGGMGAVFRATDLTRKLPCAVKVLEGRLDAELVGRFEREVELLRRVRHPGVVRYIDSGVAEHGAPFLVMEWIAGEDLRARLRRTWPTLFEALSLAGAVASVLAELHAAGVVHRDVKPANLMLPTDTFDPVRLVDFGIARSVDLHSSRLTQAGFTVGTPGYMAPEQILRTTVDGRADVFALGCILFQLVTGRRVFENSDSMAVMSRVVLEDAPRARRFRPELPQAVDDLIAEMLARRVDDRLRSSEVLPRLEAAASSPVARSFGSPRRELAPLRKEATQTDHSGLDVELAASVAPSTHLSNEPEPTLSTIVLQGTPFFGRERELAALPALLVPGARVAVVGPIGVGKTRLVREVVDRLGDARAVHWLVLEHVDDEAGVIAALSTLLGVERRAASPGVLRAALSSLAPSDVVVLDGVDAVAPALDAVLRDPLGALRAAVVVCGREAPAWCSERLELAALGTDAPTTAGALSEAARLLDHRVRAARATPGPSPSAIAEVAARLAGNPLALELAAASLAQREADELLRVLPASDKRPSSSVGAALDAAWRSLDEPGRAAVRRLARFVGELTLDEAREALRGSGTREPDRMLELLLRRAFLSAESSHRGTFSLAPALRRFVESRGDGGDGADAHAEWLVARFTPIVEVAEATNDRSLLNEINRRLGDLRRVSRRADLLGARALRVLDASIVARGPATAQLTAVMTALAVVPRTSEHELLHASLLRIRGRALGVLGRHDAALVDLEAARETFIMLEATDAEALCLLDLAALAHAQGEVTRGAQHLAAMLHLTRTGPERPFLVARALGNLGALAHDAGDLDQAYARYVEAIARAEAADDDHLLGAFLNNLAVLDADRGEATVARTRLLRAVARLGAAGDQRLAAIATGNLGMIEIELGHHAVAERRLARAAGTLQMIGDDRSECLARARLGALLALTGNLAAADAEVARARTLARDDARTTATVGAFAAFLDLARGTASIGAVLQRLERLRLPTGALAMPLSDDIRAAHRVLERIAERGTRVATGVDDARGASRATPRR